MLVYRKEVYIYIYHLSLYLSFIIYLSTYAITINWKEAMYLKESIEEYGHLEEGGEREDDVIKL